MGGREGGREGGKGGGENFIGSLVHVHGGVPSNPSSLM